MRPSAWEIHEWLAKEVKLEESEVYGIQLDSFTNCVFVKMITSESCEKLLERCEKSVKFKHADGAVSEVKVSNAGLGVRKIRIVNLPFEVTNEAIRQTFREYGEVLEINDDVWAEQLNYKKFNGVKVVKMNLKKHIPSYAYITGSRALIIYEGQPKTCAICNATDHMRLDCPRKQMTVLQLRYIKQKERQGGVISSHQAQGVDFPKLPPHSTSDERIISDPKDNNKRAEKEINVATQAIELRGNSDVPLDEPIPAQNQQIRDRTISNSMEENRDVDNKQIENRKKTEDTESVQGEIPQLRMDVSDNTRSEAENDMAQDTEIAGSDDENSNNPYITRNERKKTKKKRKTRGKNRSQDDEEAEEEKSVKQGSAPKKVCTMANSDREMRSSTRRVAKDEMYDRGRNVDKNLGSDSESWADEVERSEMECQ